MEKLQWAAENVLEQKTPSIHMPVNCLPVRYPLIKRYLDICISLVMLILLSPLFLAIACLVKLTSSGPVIFKHRRVGQYGRPLGMYKFRTMVCNAEELMKTFTPQQMSEFQENYKLKEDPRITRAGKFLRKTSLDELPQLINILKGEMSLVGPRPVVEAELAKYGDQVDRLLSVKPGLTGLWQVNGRSDTTYEERIGMDMAYIDYMEFALDIKIIFRTAWKILARKGAY